MTPSAAGFAFPLSSVYVETPLCSDDAKLERDGRVWFRDALSADDLGLLDRACEVSGAPGGSWIGTTVWRGRSVSAAD